MGESLSLATHEQGVCTHGSRSVPLRLALPRYVPLACAQGSVPQGNADFTLVFPIAILKILFLCILG